MGKKFATNFLAFCIKMTPSAVLVLIFSNPSCIVFFNLELGQVSAKCTHAHDDGALNGLTGCARWRPLFLELKIFVQLRPSHQPRFWKKKYVATGVIGELSCRSALHHRCKPSANCILIFVPLAIKNSMRNFEDNHITPSRGRRWRPRLLQGSQASYVFLRKGLIAAFISISNESKKYYIYSQ